jgi:hypothetical protein
MSILDKLLGRNTAPKARVRVCIECGMPVDAHKDWCAILQTRLEIEGRRAPRHPQAPVRPTSARSGTTA